MRHTYIEMFMCKCISIHSFSLFAFNPIFILRTIFLQLDDFFIYYSLLFLFECHFFSIVVVVIIIIIYVAVYSDNSVSIFLFFSFFLFVSILFLSISTLSLLNWCQKISPMIPTFRMIHFFFLLASYIYNRTRKDCAFVR